MGVEPTHSAPQADVLPLYDNRHKSERENEYLKINSYILAFLNDAKYFYLAQFFAEKDLITFLLFIFYEKKEEDCGKWFSTMFADCYRTELH